MLKAENLQRTGSFKVRGVAAKLAALGDEGCANGVVAACAGNHAQALAAGAAARGVPCEVFVPTDAPMAKVEAARGQGATVHVGGKSVDECLIAALERAETGGLAFVHPFDDPAIVAGQGSLGLELLEDVPDLGQGRRSRSAAAGCAPASRSRSRTPGPTSRSSASRPPPARRSRSRCAAGEPIEATSAITIADGIAIKRPGGITLADPAHALPDDMVVVGEDATAEAMALLLERCKLVVEGAGAVGVAALLGGQVSRPRRRDRRGPVRRERRRRPAGRDRPPPRDRVRAPARPAHPHPGPARRPRDAARRGRRRPAPTSSTSATCAKGSTCTCARPRSSSCSRRAATSTRSASSPRSRRGLRGAGPALRQPRGKARATRARRRCAA